MFVNLKWDLYAILATFMVVCMPRMYFLQFFTAQYLSSIQNQKSALLFLLILAY